MSADLLLAVLITALVVLTVSIGRLRAYEQSGRGNLTHSDPPNRDQERQLSELRALSGSRADVHL